MQNRKTLSYMWERLSVGRGFGLIAGVATRRRNRRLPVLGPKPQKLLLQREKIRFLPNKAKKGGRASRQSKGKGTKRCIFCRKPLLQKIFRDAVKDHCHITGSFRGAAHNACNNKLKIKPKTMPIPVVFHNQSNLVPRVCVTLIQRNGKRRTLGYSVSERRVIGQR